MITHTSYSRQIPSQNKTKSKLQIWNKLPKMQIFKICVVAVMRRRRRLGCFIHFIVQVATVLHARNEDEEE